MFKRYLINAFSVSMIPNGGNVYVKPVTKEIVANVLKRVPFTSAIGHADTAAIVSNELGIRAETNRVNVILAPGDQAYIAQYVGPRLPEGTKVLPEGSTIKYFMVDIEGGLTPYDKTFHPGSIYSAIMEKGKALAKGFNGTTNAMQDVHGNFYVVVDAPGFHAELHDDM